MEVKPWNGLKNLKSNRKFRIESSLQLKATKDLNVNQNAYDTWNLFAYIYKVHYIHVMCSLCIVMCICEQLSFPHMNGWRIFRASSARSRCDIDAYRKNRSLIRSSNFKRKSDIPTERFLFVVILWKPVISCYLRQTKKKNIRENLYSYI